MREMACLPLLLLFVSILSSAQGGKFESLGMNYGTLGDNLPSAVNSVKLIKSLHAGGVKIYDSNPAILRALAGSRLLVSIMIPNLVIASLAANQSQADAWIATHLLPFYPKTRIRYLLVGNEVLSDNSIKSTWPSLVPAVENLHRALLARSIRNVKIGTPLAMDALQASSPPSAGQFRADVADTVIRPLLRFANETRSFYFIDVYPYFPWASNPSSISLDYALFRGNPSTNYHDPVTKLTYTNLLDQMLDSVVAAMGRLGFGSVPLFIAETGWPNAGDVDEIGANIHNAATYNWNLARRLEARPPVGTPARPGAEISVFLFALCDENQKTGRGTERHWGLFYPNGTAIYDVDLTGRKPESAYVPLPAADNNEPYKGKMWCVLREGKLNKTEVKRAIAYACGQGSGTCDAIKPSGACYRNDSLAAQASFAFNSYWQQFRRTGGSCSFDGLAAPTAKDPSNGSCKFLSN